MFLWMWIKHVNVSFFVKVFIFNELTLYCTVPFNLISDFVLQSPWLSHTVEIIIIKKHLLSVLRFWVNHLIFTIFTFYYLNLTSDGIIYCALVRKTWLNWRSSVWTTSCIFIVSMVTYRVRSSQVLLIKCTLIKAHLSEAIVAVNQSVEGH